MLTAVKRRFQSEDHYYWITSYLAARGRQRVTCRFIAFSIVGLGVIPTVMMLGDLGPRGPLAQGLAVAVLTCCVAMASLWSRAKWPSRAQSQSSVLLGSACIAVACLIQQDPRLGLAGANAFIVVSAFSALFHDGRMVAAACTVGAFTIGALAIRLGDLEPAATVSGIALCAFINAFVIFSSRNLVRLVNPDVHYGELEPLTGLLTRDAFSDRVATMIAARDRTDDRFLAILVVSLDSFSLLTAMSGDAGGNEARVSIGHRLGATLRRDALLAHVGESEYLVADSFTTTDAAVLTDRLQHTVRTAPYRLTASIGVVVTPLSELVGYPPHDLVEELITIASSNVYTARRQGGQRAVVTTNPKLTSTEEFGSSD
jgi:diguanylate cyclase (GGDEF)-like protein